MTNLSAHDLYILTAADGFTTCVRAHPMDLAEELLRVRLPQPIACVRWKRVNGHGPYNGWKQISAETL